MQRDQDTANDQDQRTGGYGGSSGGQDPNAEPKKPSSGASAAGRDNPGADSMDADEAMGNRTGGYGGTPQDVDPEESGDRS